MEDVWTHYWPSCLHLVQGPTAVWPVRFGAFAGTGKFIDACAGWPVRDLEPVLDGCL